MLQLIISKRMLGANSPTDIRRLGFSATSQNRLLSLSGVFQRNISPGEQTVETLDFAIKLARRIEWITHAQWGSRRSIDWKLLGNDIIDQQMLLEFKCRVIDRSETKHSTRRTPVRDDLANSSWLEPIKATQTCQLIDSHNGNESVIIVRCRIHQSASLVSRYKRNFTMSRAAPKNERKSYTSQARNGARRKNIEAIRNRGLIRQLIRLTTSLVDVKEKPTDEITRDNMWWY